WSRRADRAAKLRAMAGAAPAPAGRGLWADQRVRHSIRAPAPAARHPRARQRARRR
ncbi:MAG: hypothetical protein AVDCRST_MAG45-1586, partial [uncultured Solirubrobacterales bacterium]